MPTKSKKPRVAKTARAKPNTTRLQNLRRGMRDGTIKPATVAAR